MRFNLAEVHTIRHLDGNGVFSNTNELDETSTFNLTVGWANEQLTRQPTTSVSPVYTQTHDAAGRQTDDARPVRKFTTPTSSTGSED
jgi:hypothetical protein